MKKVVLCIMDGIGVSQSKRGNAVKQALTPNLDEFLKKYPNALLKASGIDVGLPENQMGNSEVGHMNLGAGRIVYQLYEQINKTISDDKLKQNSTINKIIKHVKTNSSSVHIGILLSDGGVHSHINHLNAFLEICKKNNLKTNLHIITDGRDTDINGAIKFIDQIKYGNIVSMSGRYYAMDRNENYDRTKMYYDVIMGVKEITKTKPKIYLKENYKQGITDEYLKPVLLSTDFLRDNDAFVFLNFRSDRSRQIMQLLMNNQDETMKLKNILYVGMTDYSKDCQYETIFPNVVVEDSLGQILSKNKINQYRLAETEKYAHVTYYFDGGIEENYPGCVKKLIKSKNNYSYAKIPAMSAYEITSDLLDQIKSNKYEFILVNYANGDMVGHTGDLDAAVKAVEVVDDCIGLLNKACLDNDYILIITADHGNCEKMLNSNNDIVTSHTTNPVAIIINDNKYALKSGKLADVAPSVLNVMDIEIPSKMTGNIIISEANCE